MLELEARIAAWRERMAAKLPAETVRELEMHLRDHVEAGVARGRSAEEVFAEGVARIGDAGGIARAYDQLTISWVPRLRSTRLVVTALAVALALMLPTALQIYTTGRGILLGAHVLVVTLGYLAVSLTGVLGLCGLAGRRTPRELREHAAWLYRFSAAGLAMTSLGIVLGMIWASGHLGRAWDWDPKEMGATVVALSGGVLLFAQDRLAQEAPGRWLLGLLASLAVLVGWFGAAVMKDPLSIALAGLALVGAQLAVLLFGWRPLGGTSSV